VRAWRPVATFAADPALAVADVAPHVHRTPLLRSSMLSGACGFDVRLKAELLQRTGSYKIRGPLHKFARLSAQERERGVVCSSAGNHAQGVALAASIYGLSATVVMAVNATPSKIAATRGYGAEVVLQGEIWDEADAHARRLVQERGLTYVHPFDDLDLIAGQGTVGIEIHEDLPEVDVVLVPIGGGGLISGVALALKRRKPHVRIIGVESAGAPGMQRSVREGRLVTLDRVDTPIDGLRVRTVGETTLKIVQSLVDEVITVPDEQIFDAVVWLMSHCKLVAEGAAAAPVAALLNGLVDAPPGATVVTVLSGGNLDLSALRGMRWN
jgi:threonine dehydratase